MIRYCNSLTKCFTRHDHAGVGFPTPLFYDRSQTSEHLQIVLTVPYYNCTPNQLRSKMAMKSLHEINYSLWSMCACTGPYTIISETNPMSSAISSYEYLDAYVGNHDYDDEGKTLADTWLYIRDNYNPDTTLACGRHIPTDPVQGATEFVLQSLFDQLYWPIFDENDDNKVDVYYTQIRKLALRMVKGEVTWGQAILEMGKAMSQFA